MKKIVTKSAFVLGLTLSSLCPISAENQPNETTNNNIQDTQRAAQYFEDELNFKTNSYFVNQVIQGKVPNVTIVDVRSADAYAKGHIPGAINLPDEKYNYFNGSETEFPGLRKDGFNLVYCYTKTCNLGQKAAKKFTSLGYPVKEIVGGYELWTEEKGGNNPVEKGDAKKS